MNRIFEFLSDLLTGTINFFDSLRRNRHDDPLVAEYKAKQRACLWSPVPFFVVLVLGWASGTILNVIDGLAGAQAPVSAARDWLALGFCIAAGLSFAYVLLTWGALYRFAKKHQIQ